MKRSFIIKALIIFIVCFSVFQLYNYRYNRVEKEGFTQLLYSRIRPHTRTARLLYEDTLENVFKHFDRFYYNLGKR